MSHTLVTSDTRAHHSRELESSIVDQAILELVSLPNGREASEPTDDGIAGLRQMMVRLQPVGPSTLS